MAVPLQRESGQAKLHSGAHFILRGLIDSKLPDCINLAIAVAFVLGGMELVSLRCARREAVVPGELAVNFLGNFPRVTNKTLNLHRMLALTKINSNENIWQGDKDICPGTPQHERRFP